MDEVLVTETVDEYDRDSDGVILVDLVSLALRDLDAENDRVCDTDPVKDFVSERVKLGLRVAENVTLEERVVDREAEFEPVTLGVCDRETDDDRVCDRETDDDRVCDNEPAIDFEPERLNEALRVLDLATLSVRLNERDIEVDAVTLGVCDRETDDDRVCDNEPTIDLEPERLNEALRVLDLVMLSVRLNERDAEIDAVILDICEREADEERV